MPSDLAFSAPGRSPYPPQTPTKSTRWTEADKALAFAVFADTNNINEASRVSGVPLATVHSWINSEWAQEYTQQLRDAIRSRVGFVYAQLAVRALQVALTALEQGDAHLTAKGNVIYLPVKGRDAAMIAAIATDKHAMITGMLENQRGVDKQLHDIAEQLLKRVTDIAAQAAPPAAIPPMDTGVDYLG